VGHSQRSVVNTASVHSEVDTALIQGVAHKDLHIRNLARTGYRASKASKVRWTCTGTRHSGSGDLGGKGDTVGNHTLQKASCDSVSGRKSDQEWIHLQRRDDVVACVSRLPYTFCDCVSYSSPPSARQIPSQHQQQRFLHPQRSRPKILLHRSRRERKVIHRKLGLLRTPRSDPRTCLRRDEEKSTARGRRLGAWEGMKRAEASWGYGEVMQAELLRLLYLHPPKNLYHQAGSERCRHSWLIQQGSWLRMLCRYLSRDLLPVPRTRLYSLQLACNRPKVGDFSSGSKKS
jgi:hypothetical protein